MWRAAARGGRLLLGKDTLVQPLHQAIFSPAAASAFGSSFRQDLLGQRLLQPVTTRSFATRVRGRVRTRRYKTPRSKRVGPRRLIPRPSLSRKPPTFEYRSPKDKLTKAEVEHEKFKQVLSRLQIRQLAWRTDDPTTGHSKNDYAKDENKCLMRRAAGRVNPFATIPTFRRKQDCGPPPISMKKKKGVVMISRITFGENTKGVGKIKSFKEQMKKLKSSRRATNLRLAKYNEKRTSRSSPPPSYYWSKNTDVSY